MEHSGEHINHKPTYTGSSHRHILTPPAHKHSATVNSDGIGEGADDISGDSRF